MSVRPNIVGLDPEPAHLGLKFSGSDRIITSGAAGEEGFGLIDQLKYKPAPCGHE